MTVSVEWEIKATEFANCNCSYACPCQFTRSPTHGHCRYVAGFQIEQGHFGDVKLRRSARGDDGHLARRDP